MQVGQAETTYCDVLLEQSIDVVGGVLRGDFVGATVACWGSAAGLAFREDDLDAGLVEDLHHRLAHVGIGKVDQAAGIEGCLLLALAAV